MFKVASTSCSVSFYHVSYHFPKTDFNLKGSTPHCELNSKLLINKKLNFKASFLLSYTFYSPFNFFIKEFRFSRKKNLSKPRLFHCVSEHQRSVSSEKKIIKRTTLNKLLSIDKRNAYREEDMKSMASRPILQEGVYRFDADEEAFIHAFPSLSFESSSKREMKINGRDFDSEGKFTVSCLIENGDQIVLIKFSGETNFYGTGEVSGSLERTGRRIFTWNTDSWGYNSFSPSLYQSHPFVFCVLKNGNCVAFLADTTKKCDVDLRKDSTIKFKSNQFYPIIAFGPFQNPNEVLTSLSNAIGKSPLPPLWALGFHQCRFSYEPDSRVLQVANTFREKKLPCDVIWMDIDYMNKFLCFTFDPVKFPNPKELINDLKELNFKTIWMIDPGIKVDKTYFVYKSGKNLDVFVKREDGEDFEGEVWPGTCSFPDFTMQKTREWWTQLICDFCKIGLDGIWNDMNEPSVFKVMSKTMPENNIHRGDENIGGVQNHAHYHNVYGTLMAKSTFEGFQMAQKTKRPFVLSRAGFIGGQRYSATWTGDNLADWQHLHWSITMALNLSLSGQPFSGPDIGGFGGNSSARLFARWMGIGCLLPFARAHSETGTIDHEPWAFGKECEYVCKLALERRYKLLPHFYTLFYYAYKFGLPVMKPLFFEDTKDERLRKVENVFLLGNLLVVANTKEDEFLFPDKVVLPFGIWNRFDFDDYHEDIPLLFAKGGSILFSTTVVQSTDEYSFENDLNLIITLNENGYAEGELYEDEGNGYAFKEGKYLLTKYRACILNSDWSKIDGSNSFKDELKYEPETEKNYKNGPIHNPNFENSLAEKEILIEIFESSGSIPRPNRKINFRILLNDGAEITGNGMYGEKIIKKFPSQYELNRLTNLAKSAFNLKLKECENRFSSNLKIQKQALKKITNGTNLQKVSIFGQFWKLEASNLKGRINSIYNIPLGKELLSSNFEFGGYEEFFNSQILSSENFETFSIIADDVAESEFEFRLKMEADIGGGLICCRQVFALQDSPNVLQIHSAIHGRNLGVGSGGLSRIVRLRIRPNFHIQSPSQTFVHFFSLEGEEVQIYPEFGEAVLSGNDRPNGVWSLVDLDAGVKLVNRFDIDGVELCFLHWGENYANLELWSKERPVSESSPLQIHHEYEIIRLES